MISLDRAIIVEGKYDKIKLSQFVDTIIFSVNGFAVFNNPQTRQSIKTLAETVGIVILTDSDSAGLKIRNRIKQITASENIIHAYIPQISGKEKRKQKASKEGFLGVEGMTEEIIRKALEDAGCFSGEKIIKNTFTKADLFALGLSGTPNSSILRNKLAQKLGIPSQISANMLLDVINSRLTREEALEIINNIETE